MSYCLLKHHSYLLLINKNTKHLILTHEVCNPDSTRAITTINSGQSSMAFKEAIWEFEAVNTVAEISAARGTCCEAEILSTEGIELVEEVRESSIGVTESIEIGSDD